MANRLAKKGFKTVFYNEPFIHDTRSTFKDFIKKEMTGAKSFSETSLKITGLTVWELLYEHIILGSKEMFKNIIHGKLYWFWYPIMVISRLGIFALIFTQKKLSIGKYESKKNYSN